MAFGDFGLAFERITVAIFLGGNLPPIDLSLILLVSLRWISFECLVELVTPLALDEIKTTIRYCQGKFYFSMG